MAAHHCYFQSSRALCTAQNFAHSDSAALLSAASAWAALPAETSGARSLDVIPRATQSCRQIQLLVPLTALSKGGKLPAAFLVQARVQSHSLGFQIARAGCWVRLPGNVPMLKIQWKITAVSGGKVFLLSFACGFYAVHIYCCMGSMAPLLLLRLVFLWSGSFLLVNVFAPIYVSVKAFHILTILPIAIHSTFCYLSLRTTDSLERKK